MGVPKTQFNYAILFALHCVCSPATAQQCASVRTERVLLLTGGFALGQTAAIAVRSNDWWTTPTTSFHVVWDGSPNREQDGLLHAALAYQTTQIATLAWEWACATPGTATWLGVATSLAVGLPKEIGDGLHTDKGFSLRDFTWTAVGAVLPALHRTVPATKSLLVKVSYWPSNEFRNRPPGALPQLENDYAGQRYFLAFNPGRLPGGARPWPSWLGVAVGHSVPYWISQPPIHEWYVTLDLNMRGLPVRAPWWRKVATVLDQIHFPLPGVRVRDGRWSVGLY